MNQNEKMRPSLPATPVVAQTETTLVKQIFPAFKVFSAWWDRGDSKSRKGAKMCVLLGFFAIFTICKRTNHAQTTHKPFLGHFGRLCVVCA